MIGLLVGFVVVIVIAAAFVIIKIIDMEAELYIAKENYAAYKELYYNKDEQNERYCEMLVEASGKIQELQGIVDMLAEAEVARFDYEVKLELMRESLAKAFWED